MTTVARWFKTRRRLLAELSQLERTCIALTHERHTREHAGEDRIPLHLEDTIPVPLPPTMAADAAGAPLPGRLLSVAEVAEHLGISRAHVYNLLHRGLPSIKVGSCRRFRRADVDAYFAAREAARLAHRVET